LVLLIAIFVLAAKPGYAQDQQRDTAKLKADTEKVVKVISGDKLKIQTYCEIADLNDEIDEANQNQDTEKVEELSVKADELERKLGPEFSELVGSLKDVDPNSHDGREIGSILDNLDDLCGD